MKTALIMHTQAEHFATPAYAVKPLLQYLKPEWTIWEPTDTTGAISGVLKEHGFTVESTTFDFLTSNVKEGFDCIITNPPFPKKDQFIRKCIDYGKPFALLLPITAFEGQRRGRMWREIGDAFGCLVFDKRVEYTGGGVWFNTSWFTSGILPKQVIFWEL